MITLDSENRIRWDGRRPGHYEVYYLKLNSEEQALAAWLRYTLLSPVPGNGQAVGELWGIVTGPGSREKHSAFKQTFPIAQVGMHSHPFELRISESLLTSDRCFGQIASREGELRWDLALTQEGEPYHNLPWVFYHLPLPRTKLVAPHLSCRASGVLTVNGASYSLRGVPAHQAHIWGTRHASRWVWANCNLFKGGTPAVLEALSAQIPLGSSLTPPLTSLTLRVGDEAYVFKGLRHLLRSRTNWNLNDWHLEAWDRTFRVEAVVHSRPEWMVGVRYQDPDGLPRVCNNTKVADLEVKVFRCGSRGKQELIHRLTADGTCAFEVVEREPSLEVSVRI